VAARFPKCLCVLSPGPLIEVDYQTKTGFVLKHRINAHDKILAVIVVAQEMTPDRIVRDREKSLVSAITTFNPRLLTYSPHPFVSANRLIAGPSGLSAFKSAGIDILAAAEERSEESDFSRWWRAMIDPVVREVAGNHRLARHLQVSDPEPSYRLQSSRHSGLEMMSQRRHAGNEAIASWSSGLEIPVVSPR
jgi:hypothetical protein